MQATLDRLIKEAKTQLDEIKNITLLNSLKLKYFGKNGLFTAVSGKISVLPASEKPGTGRLINSTKKELEKLFTEKKEILINLKEGGWFDVTYPGEIPVTGHLHPQSIVLYDLIEIFRYLGFQVAEGPEIESNWYNFLSLNFPPDHPAMDTQQSLRVSPDSQDKSILRTQTSSMQVRVLEKSRLPLKVIVPGKCFRYEAVDASHGFEFWQLEGFAVDKNISLTDLFGTIDFVLKNLMGPKTKLRFACTNFPFVEPGVDTYMECSVCQGLGCSFCKNLGWSEIMPAGMIHPNVLKAAKIDPQVYQGFAFAIGLSRAVTLRYGISDLRMLTTPDLRILNQF